MAADAILEIGINVTDGLVVYENMINKHINEELPFMATETILMEAVKIGGDRHELHEIIREYSMKAAYRVKQEGLNNNLIELIIEDPSFKMSKEEILSIMDPKNFVGRAPEQVVEFINETLDPAINEYKDGSLGVSARSDGSVNVQIIMEELGGGGHQTVAGVQLDNMRAADVEPQIIALAKKQLEQLEEKDNNESDSVTRC
jgi:oligoribonuclease NrnB/cAMP/cGMP phosphodiesterase (DHH superfamily)